MAAEKNRVSPARSWRAEFYCAYRESRFKDARELYARFATPAEKADIVCLAAQANLFVDPGVALQLLIDLPVTKDSDRVERDSLLAETFARTKDFESADAYLDSAMQTALALKDEDLIASVGYRMMRRHLHDENPREARKALAITRRYHSVKARFLALLGEACILPLEARVLEQANCLIEILRSVDLEDPSTVTERAWATHLLSGLAWDLYIPDALPVVERQLGGALWPPDFNQDRFQSLRGLGWAKALQGDYFNAARHLKAASAFAGTTAWQAISACERARLARCVDEHRWSRAELDEAQQLAERVNWHDTNLEERLGLLLLADLFSTIDTARSSMYLATFRNLGEVNFPIFVRHDARVSAYAAYSTGVVELALGNRKRGLAELRRARPIFDCHGYEFRAARCLVEEYRATGNRDLLPLIDERLRNYRQSWLYRELRDVMEPPQISLPPMQKRVFDELCQGKSTAEIAQSLERSEYTISNHIKELFKAFDVKSRSALLAKAVKQGLI